MKKLIEQVMEEQRQKKLKDEQENQKGKLNKPVQVTAKRSK